MPGKLPKHPGDVREGTFEGCNLPAIAPVKADINFGDTFVTRESNSTNVCYLFGRNVRSIQGRIDAGGQAYGRGITPTTLLPVALIILRHNLDVRQPLTMLHAIYSRDKHAHRETMALWQGRSIHTHSQQRGRLKRFIQVNTIAIVVRRIEDNFLRARLHSRTLQQVFQPHAFPQSVAHIYTTNLVADTHHRFVLSLHRQSQQLLVVERVGMVNVAINGQLPTATIDHRIGEEVFRDDVILVIRSNLRREEARGLNLPIVRYGWRHYLTLIMLQ